jgi:hypothetical protein
MAGVAAVSGEWTLITTGVVSLGLLALMRKYESKTVLSAKLSGNGKDLSVETTSVFGTAKTETIPISSFLSTNKFWPVSSFWLTARLTVDSRPRILLFESSGEVSNVRFFNKILAGEKTFKSCLKKKK